MSQPGPSGIKRKKSSIKTEVPSTASVSQLNADSDNDSDDTIFINRLHRNSRLPSSPKTKKKYLNANITKNSTQSSRSELLTAPDLQLDWVSDSSIGFSDDDEDDDNDEGDDEEVVYVPSCAEVCFFKF